MASRRKQFSLVAVLLSACLAAGAQTGSAAAGASRLAGDWSSSAPVAIPGSRPPMSVTGDDQGAAPAEMPLNRMLLLLAPSDAQQQALTAELTALQNPNSPEYRHWLTPEEFAVRYSNSAADVAAVSDWLQSQGFQVAPLPAGRGWIEFSGTVAQAEQAFHAPIHLIAGASGSARPVFTTDISVPGALRPLIAGVVSLDGVVAAPALAEPQPLSTSPSELAAETSPSGTEALTPRMLAQLVDLGPLTSAGITGAGQTIAIASRSDIRVADVAVFRSTFGLPPSPVEIQPSGSDPGRTASQAEATFAASWAGAAAPGAKILLVPAGTTEATDGLDLSLAAIIDQDLAATAVVGYSACEAGMSAAHQAYDSAVYRQAAAEGLAVIAAAGDSGAAACTLPGSGAPVSSGYGVNALASTPWDTAVGVAAFGDGGPAAGGSALAAWSPLSPADPAYAGGGGGSRLYRDPAWQPMPAQLAAHTAPARLLPDLSLPAAIDTGANSGLAFCMSGTAATGGCTWMRSGGSAAAASLFAGIAARRAQQHGAEGNLAPILYKLSAQPGIFGDVTQGAAQLKCAAGSPGCDGNGKIGFVAGAGYDLTTGLGVPDAKALVLAQPQATGTSPVTVTNTIATGQVINPSGSVVLSATVASGTGGAAPTGTVTFYDQTLSSNLVTVSLTPGATSSTASQTVTGMLAQGNHQIVAEYSGDGTYQAANSTAVLVQSAPSATTITVRPVTTSSAAGSALTVSATIVATNPGSTPPTGTVNFTLDGITVATSNVLSGPPATATGTVPLVSAGAHVLAGTYSGDAFYTDSTSSPVGITVAKGTTVTTVTATPSTLSAGTTETLTATVAPTNPVKGVTYTITGGVSFYDGAKLLGQVALTNNTATLSGLDLANNISHSITAVYAGDVNWLGSTSVALPLAATTLPDVVQLTANYSVAQPGVAVVLTATVMPTVKPAATAEQNPTGTVVFYNGTKAIGTALLVASSIDNSSTATLTTQTLPGGQVSLTAFYKGDLSYDSATSNALTLTVEGFILSPASSNPPTNLNVAQGNAGSVTFNVTGLGGFDNAVQVECQAPAQDDMTCTATPQQVTPPGSVTFTVQTFKGPHAENHLPPPFWPRAAGGTALAALIFLLVPFGRRARTFVRLSSRRMLLLLLLLIGLGGAGIGCSSGSGLATFGTPLGVATFKVTAQAYVDNTTVSQSVYFTVNVLAPGSTQ